MAEPPRPTEHSFRSAVATASVAYGLPTLGGTTGVPTLFLSGARPVVAGIGAVAVGVVVSTLIGWPGGTDSAASTGSAVLSILTAVIGFLGVLTVALSLSISVVQSTLGRTPEHTDEALISLLATDDERDALLKLIVFGVLVSLGDALLLAGNLVSPFVAAVVPVVVAAVALGIFAGYVRARVRLFELTGLTRFLLDRAAGDRDAIRRLVAGGRFGEDRLRTIAVRAQRYVLAPELLVGLGTSAVDRADSETLELILESIYAFSKADRTLRRTTPWLRLHLSRAQYEPMDAYLLTECASLAGRTSVGQVHGAFRAHVRYLIDTATRLDGSLPGDALVAARDARSTEADEALFPPEVHADLLGVFRTAAREGRLHREALIAAGEPLPEDDHATAGLPGPRLRDVRCSSTAEAASIDVDALSIVRGGHAAAWGPCSRCGQHANLQLPRLRSRA
jgi:hypothetical protein